VTKQNTVHMAAIVVVLGLLLAGEGFAGAAELQQVQARVDVMVGQANNHVFVYVTNFDVAREFQGVVDLRFGVTPAFIVPPMSTEVRDFECRAWPDGYDVQGRMVQVWPRSRTYDIVAFVPGWRYVTLHVVASDVPTALEEVGQHCEQVYRGRLDGFQVFVYPAEARSAAEARDIDGARAVLRRNFKSGLCYQALRG